jgi:hypothetical protein
MEKSVDAWRTQAIFVSSTFNDLLAERDYLRDLVFPAVEEDTAGARCHIEVIDLRWGVDTISLPEQEQPQTAVSQSPCGLDRADNCRPEPPESRFS